MAYDGTGTFHRLYSWVVDAANGLLVDATRMDQDSNDIAAGLSNCVTRDGQSPALADIPMGGFRLTGLGAGVQPTDAATIGSPAFQGIPTAPTPPVGTNTDQLATAKMVTQAAFAATLPVQPGGTVTYDLVSTNSIAGWTPRTPIASLTGNVGKFLTTTDGSNTSWGVVVGNNLYLNSNCGGF